MPPVPVEAQRRTEQAMPGPCRRDPRPGRSGHPGGRRARARHPPRRRGTLGAPRRRDMSPAGTNRPFTVAQTRAHRAPNCCTGSAGLVRLWDRGQLRRGCGAETRPASERLLLPPRQLVARPAERLLPAELEHAPEQLEREGGVPPAAGVHAMTLERPPVGANRVVLGLGQERGVQGEVPGEVGERARPRPELRRSRAGPCGRPGRGGCRDWPPSSPRGRGCAAPGPRRRRAARDPRARGARRRPAGARARTGAASPAP